MTTPITFWGWKVQGRAVIQRSQPSPLLVPDFQRAGGNTLLLYPPFKLTQAPLGTILRHSSQLSKLGYSPVWLSIRSF